MKTPIRRIKTKLRRFAHNIFVNLPKLDNYGTYVSGEIIETQEVESLLVATRDPELIKVLKEIFKTMEKNGNVTSQ